MDADQDLRSTVDALMDGSEVIVEVRTAAEARHGGAFGGIGMDAPSVDHAASALLPYARVELNLRFHPGQDPKEAQGAPVAHSEAPWPFGIPLTVTPGDAGPGFEPATGGPAYRAARTALREGFAEETLGFYGLIVPLMLALGYDRLVATGTIIVGAGIGVLCSTVNPFATGVASSAAGISLGDGIVLRFVMWVVLTAVSILYVVRYGRRVQRDPSKSLTGFLPGDLEHRAAEVRPADGAAGPAEESSRAEPPELTRTHKLVLALLALVFAFMIFSVVPWSSALTGKADATPYRWELGWSFPQLAALFLVAAVLVGVAARLGEAELSATIIQGAADFISPALVIVLARGVTVIMNNSQITDTVLHSIEGVVKGAPSALFAVIVFVVNLPLAFLIPSTSGHATLAMPILAPLADFAGVSRAVVVTAWQAASGWMNLWVPTTAVTIGGVALAKVGYNKYLRFVTPLLGILFVLICAFVAVGAAFT
ncbi:Na+/H+ antiporter NhaC family protein [Streptomyces violascens]|uniref:YfcC family protein n=1 Tax=Streptomyces violascens TaxID=67381 RepID=UPI0036612B09